MGLFEAGMVGRHIGGIFGFGLCAALAMSAGIGGGGLFVPLLMILLEKDAKEATAMSQCLIAGAAIAGMIYNYKQRHPLRDRPLINLSAVVFLAPLQMGGALVGNLLNQIMPKYVIITLMVTVLSFSAFKTLRKGLLLWAEEALESSGGDEQDVELANLNIGLTDTSGQDHWKTFAVLFKMKMAIKKRKRSRMTYMPLSRSGSVYKGTENGGGVNAGLKSPLSEGYSSQNLEWVSVADSDNSSGYITASDFVEMEKAFLPRHWAYLGGVWVTVVVLVLARGGKGAGSMLGISYCGTGYWMLSFLALVVLFSLSLRVMFENVNMALEKQRCKYEFATGDIVWTKNTAMKLCFGTVMAGVVAGLIGIGGGMVIGPFLLDIGVIPQVSSAITATNVLLSSTTLAVLVMSSGLVVIDESVFFFFCCLLGAYLGKFYLGKVIRAYGRTSLIILLLGGVITMCILVVFTMGLISWTTTDALQEGFSGLCS